MRNPAGALSLFDTNQKFGGEICGVQLYGGVRQLSLTESVHAFAVFTKRFPKLLRWTDDIQTLFNHLEDRFFEFAITGGKMLDEATFGKEIYIDFSIVTPTEPT